MNRIGRATAPRLLLRGDASRALGFGHVARLCALADAAARAGGIAELIVGGDADAAIAFAAGLGHAAAPAPADAARDVEALVRRARDAGAAAIVVDGRAAAAELAPGLVGRGTPVAVIDDQGGAPAPVDWVVNHNYRADELVASYPRGARTLLGRDYLMLRRQVIDRGRGACVPRAAGRTRIAIVFGGSDPVGATARVVGALPAGVRVDATVITGPGFGESAALDAAMVVAASRGHELRRVDAPPDVAGVLAGTDAVITAAGGTVGELAYLGCPTCAYAIVDDQRRVAARLAADGLVHGGHDLATIDAATLRADLAAFLADPGRRARLRDAALATADGLGAGRVASALAAGCGPVTLGSGRVSPP